LEFDIDFPTRLYAGSCKEEILDLKVP